jgi:hypothetical protein
LIVHAGPSSILGCMNSEASQSSSFGLLGGVLLKPRLFGVRISPSPK